MQAGDATERVFLKQNGAENYFKEQTVILIPPLPTNVNSGLWSRPPLLIPTTFAACVTQQFGLLYIRNTAPVPRKNPLIFFGKQY